MQMKFCPGCDQNLKISDFSKNKIKKDGLQSTCKQCKKKYNQQHYQDNSTSYKERAKESGKQLKQWYKDYKSTLKCKSCPETHPTCLQFHHRDDNKTANVSRLLKYGLKVLQNEISKCDVLCANCHAKIHYAS